MSKLLKGIASISIAGAISVGALGLATGTASAHPGGDYGPGNHRHYYNPGRHAGQWGGYNYNPVSDWYDGYQPGFVQIGNMWCPPPPAGVIILIINGCPYYAPMGAPLPPYGF